MICRTNFEGENNASLFNLTGENKFEMVDKFGGQWRTSEFKMGDVLIFGMYTMHASLNNMSPKFRISADTRYQRADEPVDERWVGENPPAHYAWNEGVPVQMDEARTHWGV